MVCLCHSVSGFLSRVAQKNSSTNLWLRLRSERHCAHAPAITSRACKVEHTHVGLVHALKQVRLYSATASMNRLFWQLLSMIASTETTRHVQLGVGFVGVAQPRARVLYHEPEYRESPYNLLFELVM
jgi:hypothetical protein